MELKESMIALDQKIETKEEAIKLAGQLLVDNDVVDPSYVDGMLEREQIVSTHMGNFVAIPHGTDEAKEAVRATGISVVQVPMGVNFSPDEDQEKMAMMVFGIAGIGNEHLDLLSKIAVFCAEMENVVRLVNAESEREIIDMLEEVEA